MAPLRVLLDPVARRLRASPLAGRMWARYRTWRLERRARRILARGDGRADALPAGIVYESTMRCNLHCEFCYVGALLNVEGEWREELPLDMLQRAFPEKAGLQISLTGGEIFVRKDILETLELFRGKGYVCGYLTTNGTAITDERADALAQLATTGFLKHISVSIDGPPEVHDRARGAQARSSARPRDSSGCRTPPDGPAPRCASASTRPWRRTASRRSTAWSTWPGTSASTPSG